MKKVKVQDLADRQIFWLRNFKTPQFRYAYQRLVALDSVSILTARMKNCAQRVLSFDDMVYIIGEY